MPDELVIAIDGDGSFQMTFQEMVTAAVEGVPIKVVLINNGGHGMVKQWQRLFYEGRLSSVDLSGPVPHYAALAESMDWAGLTAETPEEVRPGLQKMLGIEDRPVLLEVRTDPDEMVFPMVPAGGSCDNIVLSVEDVL
jgi:acetolactate synthase-1/2/3 large subunit